MNLEFDILAKYVERLCPACRLAGKKLGPAPATTSASRRPIYGPRRDALFCAKARQHRRDGPQQDLEIQA